jgi:hypothetical protein
MGNNTKSINFGEIGHLLYVRIMSLCADLGYRVKDLIEEGCCLFFDIVDHKGVSHFEIVEGEYRRFVEAIQKSKPIPRMNQKHALVVKDIQDEIYEYLNCVKNEQNMNWIQFLGILLMLVEINRKKTDEQALEEWSKKEDTKFLIDEFNDIRFVFEEGFRIDKTRKLRDFERNR